MKTDTKKSQKRPQGKKIPRRITETYLHNAGLHYLQRFSTSSENFRRVLMRKVDRSCLHHQDQDRETCIRLIDELIEKFRRSGLLDDEAYTRGKVASLRRRGESARHIESRLQAKGLPRDGIRQALATAQDDGGPDDFNAALHFIRRRRLGPLRRGGPAPEKDLATMARAGYSFDVARKALKASEQED